MPTMYGGCNIMIKKISALFLILMLSLSLAACSGKKDADSTMDSETETETVSEEESLEEELPEEEEEIVVADYDPEKAQEILTQQCSDKYCVLYENDLPDNYI